MELLKGLPGEETIDHITNERVFGIVTYDDGVHLIEMCDEYFGVKLTKEICEDLSAYFGELAKRLEGVK